MQSDRQPVDKSEELRAFLAEWMPSTHEALVSGEISETQALDVLQHDYAIWCQDENAHQLPEVDGASRLLAAFEHGWYSAHA